MMEKMQQQMGGQPQGMGDANGAMGRAGDQLGQGKPGDATGDQSRALEALRQAQQQMQQMMQNGKGNGQGIQGGPQSQEGKRDPFGRPLNEGWNNPDARVDVPDELDPNAARRIREEIERRLNDQENIDERDRRYLERLLAPR